VKKNYSKDRSKRKIKLWEWKNNIIERKILTRRPRGSLKLAYPMGPLELADFSGLDTVLSVLQYLHCQVGDRYRPCPLLKKLVIGDA